MVLHAYQQRAVEKLRSGSILCGGVGVGKSLTALAYFWTKICGGSISENKIVKGKHPKKLYIITTARKRDTNDWIEEIKKFMDSDDISSFPVECIDSWNNVGKYVAVKDAFFIFDEQRVVGSGAWVKSFLKIAKANQWILLSATPGDTWMDYIPVFVANGFYKNRTEFLREHAVYNRYCRYPKVDRYIGIEKLEYFRDMVLVSMDSTKTAFRNHVYVSTKFDSGLMELVCRHRWNPYTGKPIRDISELCYTMRKVCNSDPSKLNAIKNIMKTHERIIVFYNFDYELDILKTLSSERTIAEWNGHAHEMIPEENSWLYLVQYMAGAEGWNCIETNTIVFYSENYSYKMMEQACGRIDRINTPYSILNYYHLKSNSMIDRSISNALRNKKNFNEKSLKIDI